MNAVRRSAVFLLGFLFFLAAPAASLFPAAAQQSAYTPLVVRINAASSMGLVMNQDAGACSIAGTGTSSGFMNLGYGTDAAASTCGTWTSGFHIITSFSINATCTGTCGGNYDVTASLSAAPPLPGEQWDISGKGLTTNPTSVASHLAYGTNSSLPFELILATCEQGGVSRGLLQTQINITATANVKGGPSATVQLSAQFLCSPGIALVFVQDPSGAAISSSGNQASLNFGSISRSGSLPAGETRLNVTANGYTVRTPVDIDVENDGVTGTSYTMRAALAAASPTGVNWAVNGVTLTAVLQTVATAGSYNTNQAYNIDVIVTNSAAVGTPLSDTLDFTATAN